MSQPKNPPPPVTNRLLMPKYLHIFDIIQHFCGDFKCDKATFLQFFQWKSSPGGKHGKPAATRSACMEEVKGGGREGTRDIDKHKMRGERERDGAYLSIYLKTKEMQQRLKFIFLR